MSVLCLVEMLNSYDCGSLLTSRCELLCEAVEMAEGVEDGSGWMLA